MAVQTAAMVLTINYGVHVGSSLLYDHVCIPHSVWEVVQSLVATASPVCSFLLNTMVATQTNYGVIVATTLTSALTSSLRYAGV